MSGILVYKNNKILSINNKLAKFPEEVYPNIVITFTDHEPILSTDLGTTWQTVSLNSSIGTGNIVQGYCSLSNQNNIAIGSYNSGFAITKDRGETWSTYDLINRNYNLSMSDDGQKIGVGDQYAGKYGKLSLDGGTTWYTVHTSFSIGYQLFQILISKDGLYGVASGKGMNRCYNLNALNESSWVQRSSYLLGSGSPGIYASLDGKYVIYTNSTWTPQGVKLSTDYGETYNVLFSGNKACASLSRDGKYMSYTAYNDGFYFSNDYGTNFNKLTSMYNIIIGGMSYSGQYMIGRDWNNLSNIYLTQDGGNTKTLVSSNSFNNPWCDETGQYMMYYDSNNKEVMLSTNYGSVFSSMTLPVDLNTFNFRAIQRYMNIQK